MNDSKKADFPLEVNDLARSIRSCVSTLKGQYEIAKFETSYDEMYQEIKLGFDERKWSQYVIDDLFLFFTAGANIKAMSDNGYSIDEGVRKVPFILCSIYAGYAEIMHKQGEAEAAWCYLAEAKYWLGTTELISLYELYLEEHDSKRIKSKKGGEAKSRNHSFYAKDKARKLLEELRPHGGWSDIDDAVKAITEGVNKVIAEFKVKLRPERTPANLRRWIEQEEELLAAYEGRAVKEKP